MAEGEASQGGALTARTKMPPVRAVQQTTAANNNVAGQAISSTKIPTADDEDDTFGLNLSSFKLSGNAWFALGFLSIIAVLLLPMPKWLLDLSLAFSISFSLLILVTTLLIHKPIEFSSFPTILLVATLIRLSLNVASTRLILTDGYKGIGAAGEVIKAFASFIMSGNFVIGMVVFIILVIINFVVITKGSGRIAEVSARFTLDAMPGKQMAIDADLSAGLINEDEAKARRKELTDESNFYGAMDGASKFVRGDAVAGLIITAINVIGGIIIGVVQSGMTFMDATRTYTYLTVGDGLVSQIPALVVSIGAGMLVTKGASTSGGSGEAMAGQLAKYPMALAMASGIMAIMGVLPGIPFIPFMLLSVGCGVASWMTFTTTQKNVKKARIQAVMEEKQKRVEASQKEEAVETSLKMDEVRLELGFALLPLLKGESGAKPLPEQIKTVRRQLASEMGFLLPSVRIQDNLQLGSGGYEIYIKEVTSGSGEVRPHLLLALNPGGEEIDLPGEDTVEPTFNLPAKWVTPDIQEVAEKQDITIVHPSTVIVTHFTEIIKEHMSDLLTIGQVQKLIGEQEETYKKLVEEAVPSQITHAGLQRVLQNLLRERISIRDLPLILEAILEVLPTTRNVNMITEHVRMRLSRQICQACSNNEGILEIVLLSPDWERAFQDGLVGEGENRQLTLPPSRLQDFISILKEKVDDLVMQGYNPVLLTGASIRPFVRSVVERAKPSLMILSQNEIHPKAKLKTLGQI